MNGSSLLTASLTALALFAMPAVAGATSTFTVADEDQIALLADDLRFAEALAVNRFYALADEVVVNTTAKINELGSDEVELAGDASLVKARVAIRRSDSTADPDLREAAMTSAIEELRDWSRPGSAFAFLDRMTDALEDLAKTLGERGKEYARRAAEGQADAQAAADADFKEADDVFQDLRKESASRASQLEGEEKLDAAEAMNAKAALTYYLRGLNSVDWSDVATDREFRLEQAIEMIDEFLWEVSEETLVYYSATYEMARAYAKLGEPDDARELLENVLELGTPIFWEYQGENIVGEFSPGLQRIIGGLFDSVWGYLALLDVEQGNLAGATARIDAMLAEHETKQVPMGRSGHEVLLDWARKLAELGKTGEASELALRVSVEGRGTPPGGLAEVFLSSLITGGSVVIDSPDALKSAADGFFAEKNYSEASYYYLRAASLLNTPEEKAAMSYQCWQNAGRALRYLGRHLEAATAFEQALDAASAHHAAEIDKVENAANLMYQSFASRYVETQDAFDKSLRDGASQRIVSMGLDLDVQFGKAYEAFGDIQSGDTQAALAVLAEFEAVPESSANYERALVYAARCLNAAGRIDDAIKRFQVMEDRIADSSLEPTNDNARNKREVALAEERYFHAALLIDAEVNRPTHALALLEGFEEAAATQESFHPRVKWERVVAYSMAGLVDEAEEALQILQESAGVQPTFVATAAFRVANALKAKSDEAKDAEELASSRALLNRAAAALETYAIADGFSSYRNLLTNGQWYLSAQEGESALRLFEKAIEIHADDVSMSDLDSAYVGLARTYDHMLNFAQSRPVWLDLLNRNPNTVSIRRGAARSLGGWLQVQEDGSVVEIPGAGDYDMAHDIWADLFKSAKAGTNKFTSLYWEAKLGSIDTWYRQRAADPEKARKARTVLDQLRLFNPNYDKDTIENLAPELQYEPLFAPLFRHLERNLPTS